MPKTPYSQKAPVSVMVLIRVSTVEAMMRSSAKSFPLPSGASNGNITGVFTRGNEAQTDEASNTVERRPVPAHTRQRQREEFDQ